MRERNELPAGAFDNGRHDVAHREAGVAPFAVVAVFRHGVRGEAARARRGRREREEPVAAVDVERLRDRAELVRRVEVAVAEEVVDGALVARLEAVAHLGEAVLVAALGVDCLAEEPLADHVQHHQLVAAEAAVLEHHARDAGLLGGVDELPQLLDRRRPADLDGGVLAGGHRLGGEGEVGVPGRRDENALDGRIGDEPDRVGVRLRRRLAVAAEDAEHLLDPFLPDVADGGDLDAVEVLHRGHEALAARPEADHAEPDRPRRPADRLRGRSLCFGCVHGAGLYPSPAPWATENASTLRRVAGCGPRHAPGRREGRERGAITCTPGRGGRRRGSRRRRSGPTSSGGRRPPWRCCACPPGCAASR